jgi:1-acyl-sn-glycerol-3-phosphate acyltransferase
MNVARPFSLLHRYLTVYAAVPLLALICLGWSLFALPAYVLLPARIGGALGRRGICGGFRLYLGALRWLGAYQLDLSAIETLHQESGVIIAPNHPHLIDALVLLAYHPDMVCVMKSALMRNLFLAAGSRLARFICNTPPRRMINEAVAALRAGEVLLLFPEGTRTLSDPVNDFQLTVGAIAKHAEARVLTLLIETDSPYLSKGWPLFRVPALPITYRVRLGRRFPPPGDVRKFTADLQTYFCSELAHAPQSRWLGRCEVKRADRVAQS